MRDQTSGELAGLLAYLRVDDRVQEERLTRAIIRAFSGSQKTSGTPVADDDDDEVIDTTKPEFAQNFKGFTNTPAGRQPQRPMPMRSTEILMG